MTSSEKLRIDKYLWAIRIFKTRSKASKACDEGKVKFQGNAVKASRTVNIGDVFEIKTSDIRIKIEVLGLLHQRKAHAEAINYYADITPEEDKNFIKAKASSFFTGKRLSKVGRPTKKDQRDLDDFLNAGQYD